MRWPRSGWAAAAVLAALLAACSVEAPRATTPALAATPLPAATLALADGNGPERIVGHGALDRPRQPAMPPSYRADLLADYCVDRDLPAPQVDDPTMVVLDRSYALSANQVPTTWSRHRPRA